MPPGESWTDDDTDHLLDLVRTGTKEAWGALFERYEHRLRVWIRPRLPKHTRAVVGTDDILHSAFLAAIAHIKHFKHRGKGSFRAWLDRITTNELRSQTSRMAMNEHLAPTDLPSHSVRNPSEHAAAEELVALAIRAIIKLPEVDQRVLYLRILREKDWHAIAEELGVSIPTARRHYSAAIAALSRFSRSVEP